MNIIINSSRLWPNLLLGRCCQEKRMMWLLLGHTEKDIKAYPLSSAPSTNIASKFPRKADQVKAATTSSSAKSLKDHRCKLQVYRR